MAVHRPLNEEEVRHLEASGCTAQNWSNVRVHEGFDPRRVRNVHFSGSVTIGSLDGSVGVGGGMSLPAGLYDATLVDCEIGDNVRIAKVRGHVARMRIGNGVRVEDVGEIVARPGATFGNGVVVEPANEGGGREIPLFDRLSSQFAYLYLFYRRRPGLVDAMRGLLEAPVPERGEIGAGAVITRVQEMVDVRVGPHAVVSGALRLRNGTILSEQAAPSFVGAGVIAEDFIIAEGATVDGAAMLTKTFIGQGAQVGKQFSSENCLFFANSECFHGEAVSVFGGPYTVTHHKSTLLIAGTFSFYNAGSGSNQSNHMYKLGPVHQGIVERGSKTGSFSYLLWPSAIGPFSVVIGKHMTNLDTRDLPFSYIVDEGGDSVLTPAMNLHTVGTVRDGAKWPKRDRRTASVKRDRIRFEVFGPYIVGRMIRGERLLMDLYGTTPKETDRVRYKGAIIKRLMLRHTARHYTHAIDAYLREKILARGDALAATGVYSSEWADVGGLQLGRRRLDELIAAIVAGKIASLDAFEAAVDAAHDAYEEDEWAWVRHTFETRMGRSVDDLSPEDLAEMRAAQTAAASSALKKILADASNEFSEAARYGYGDDDGSDAVSADFGIVRGSFEENSFVKQVQEQLRSLLQG